MDLSITDGQYVSFTDFHFFFYSVNLILLFYSKHILSFLYISWKMLHASFYSIQPGSDIMLDLSLLWVSNLKSIGN